MEMVSPATLVSPWPSSGLAIHACVRSVRLGCIRCDSGDYRLAQRLQLLRMRVTISPFLLERPDKIYDASSPAWLP